MRITNGILARGAISGYQHQMRDLDEARERATTGLRVSRASDDPLAAAGIMQSSSGLRALEQYRRNIGTARSRMEVEDTVLDQLGNSLVRAKELGLSQGQDTASNATRAAVKQEIDGILDFVDELANTQFGGRYIFGGQHSDRPPLTQGAIDPAHPPTGSLPVEAGSQRFLDTVHSAQQMFIDTEAVAALQDLSAGLGTNDSEAIRASLARLDGAFDSIQELVGELGAGMNQLDLAASNLDAMEVNLQTFRSHLQDADLAEAVTDLVQRQGHLEAAMMANSRILSLTLTDYLR